MKVMSGNQKTEASQSGDPSTLAGSAAGSVAFLKSFLAQLQYTILDLDVEECTVTLPVFHVEDSPVPSSRRFLFTLSVDWTVIHFIVLIQDWSWRSSCPGSKWRVRPTCVSAGRRRRWPREASSAANDWRRTPPSRGQWLLPISAWRRRIAGSTGWSCSRCRSSAPSLWIRPALRPNPGFRYVMDAGPTKIHEESLKDPPKILQRSPGSPYRILRILAGSKKGP